MNRTTILTLIVFIFLAACSKGLKHPVVSKLKRSNNIKIERNIVSILFDSNELEEVTTFTRKNFTECDLVFTPVRKFNLENSLSVFLNYKDRENHIRFDIFLNTGRIHLYEKRIGKIKTYVYSKIRPFYNNHEENIYRLSIKNAHLSLAINKQTIFSDKITFSYGKTGVGAYGKKGDRVRFIFK